MEEKLARERFEKWYREMEDANPDQFPHEMMFSEWREQFDRFVDNFADPAVCRTLSKTNIIIDSTAVEDIIHLIADYGIANLAFGFYVACFELYRVNKKSISIARHVARKTKFTPEQWRQIGEIFGYAEKKIKEIAKP